MSKGFIVTLVIIGLFVSVVIFSILPVPDKFFDLATINCNQFSIVFKEKIHYAGFDGGYWRYYDLTYKKNESESRSLWFANSSMIAGYVSPPPTYTKILLKGWEFPVRLNAESKTVSNTIYLDPRTFSRLEFDQIATCLETNISTLQQAYVNDRAANNHGVLNSVSNLRFSSVAYVNENDLRAFIRSKNIVPSFHESAQGQTNLDLIFIEDNGAVTSRKRGYLGSVFDVIPPDSKSTLLSETATNDQGQTLSSYLKQLGEELKNYNGIPASRP